MVIDGKMNNEEKLLSTSSSSSFSVATTLLLFVYNLNYFLNSYRKKNRSREGFRNLPVKK